MLRAKKSRTFLHFLNEIKTSNKDNRLKNIIAIGHASAVKVEHDRFSMRNRNHRFRVERIKYRKLKSENVANTSENITKTILSIVCLPD